MSANSKIEWTDRSWQVTCGCRHRSPGCAHCYAETMAKRIKAMALADIAAGKDPGRKRHYIEVIGDDGHWNSKVVPVPEALTDPLRWKKPQMVFVDSMSDLFYGDEADRKACAVKGKPFTPVPFEFIDRVFAVMALCPQHTFQILTKRTERMAEYFETLTDRVEDWDEVEAETEEFLITTLMDESLASPLWKACDSWLGKWNARHLGWPLPNVWIGTSCEDQQRADERIPWLLKTPAAVRFLSCEPLLGPIKLDLLRLASGNPAQCACGHGHGFTRCPNTGGISPHCHYVGCSCSGFVRKPGSWSGIDWCIVGGESGHNSRPCDINWIRSIVKQCKAAGVPCFVKQLGANPHAIASFVTPNLSGGDGKNMVAWKVNHSKGGDPDEWPEDLRVREMPRVEAAS